MCKIKITNALNHRSFSLSPKRPLRSELDCYLYGAILCFRNLYFYFRHGESTSTASLLTSPASQKSKDLNKVSLLLQDLELEVCLPRNKLLAGIPMLLVFQNLWWSNIKMTLIFWIPTCLLWLDQTVSHFDFHKISSHSIGCK